MKISGTMKELPESERPYEKCAAMGPGVLSDAELLAVILRTGTVGKSSLEMAVELLQLFQSRGGLSAFAHVSVPELTGVSGIGTVKAVQLICIGELSRRIAREKTRNSLALKSPSSIAQYFMEDMRHLETEEVVAAFFNTKGMLITSRIISRGTVNCSMISPREVFLEALRQQAVYLVLLHNHPSGDPTPSAEDCRLTERIREMGEELGIPMADHIIIGDQCYVSFRESGFLPAGS